MMDPFAGIQTGDGLILHFETFQMHNPEELVALLPDLALLQFHRRRLGAWNGPGERLCRTVESQKILRMLVAIPPETSILRVSC